MVRRALALSLVVTACGAPAAGPVDARSSDAPGDAPIDADDSDGGDPFACVATIGDLAAPPELIAIRSGSPDGVALTDGAVVPMMAPPQGGIILLVGVRARNVDGCALQLTAALRDPGTNQVIALETRPAQLRIGGDGWGVPVEVQFVSMANLAVCPAAAATRDVFDQPWRLELTIDDRGRQATTAVTITPSCADVSPMWDCPCQCAADYQPGACNVPPGGG